MQRAMFIDFPDDRNTAYLDQQYMFGSSLLVAPVFCKDTEETQFYLPEGAWTSFWDRSDVIVGPKWVKRKVPYDEIPVFVKENTILALGPSGMGRPDYDYMSNLQVRVYGLKDDGMIASLNIPSGKGPESAALLTAKAEEGKLTIEVSDGKLSGPWSVAVIRDGHIVGPLRVENGMTTVTVTFG